MTPQDRAALDALCTAHGSTLSEAVRALVGALLMDRGAASEEIRAALDGAAWTKHRWSGVDTTGPAAGPRHR